jgi:hypothetical protein
VAAARKRQKAAKTPKRAATKAAPKRRLKPKVKPPAPRPIGRPTLLTPDLQAKILRYIQDGATVDSAAALAGIHRATFFEWAARGEAAEQPYADFADALAHARDAAKGQALIEVRHGLLASGKARDWKAIMRWLEAHYPEEFSPQLAVNVKLEKELNAFIENMRDRLPPDVFRQISEIMAELDAGGSREDAHH